MKRRRTGAKLLLIALAAGLGAGSTLWAQQTRQAPPQSALTERSQKPQQSQLELAEDTTQRTFLQSPKLDPAFQRTSSEAVAKAIQRGDELWHDRSLGTNGMACNMCHPDAAVTHPETFPKYKQQFGRVVSAQQFINWCIQVPLQGQTHELGSEVLVALEAYMADQNRGQVMRIGVPGP